MCLDCAGLYEPDFDVAPDGYTQERWSLVLCKGCASLRKLLPAVADEVQW